MEEKKTAEDYLIEFINGKTNIYLKNIIAFYLQNNGDIKEEDVKIIANDIILKKDVEIKKEFKINQSNISKVRLKNLKHNKGINALASNQNIEFGDNINIIFGLNGAGKSGYFRIIQGITGHISKNDVLSNIYNKLTDTNEVSCEATFEIDGQKKIINWENDCNDKLKTVKVFDTKYSEKSLEKKASDSIIAYPYKLYMFNQIIEIIDKVKKRNRKLFTRKENKTK